ncbi:MAG TPA: hypothetical protein VMB21_04720 [Candidatus Limnocylindria bacterium]|jgi:hypothetical protein|nr:hypothetical protein [Candidatus Limnocylindria bacterium]HTL67228.1 hypothetical protein [Lacunisphaera sp.]
MSNYIDPSQNGPSGFLNSLSEQLRSLQGAVELLSARAEHSQKAIESFLPVVQELDRRLRALEASSVSPQSLEQLRGDMNRFYLATQNKERLLELNMVEVKNLGRQVTALETTLSEWPDKSGP